MVTVRHSIAVIVCLMYVPHITSMFLKRSGLQNRVSTETQDSNLVLHSNIIFNGDQLQPETLVPIYGSVVLNCEVSGIPTPTIHWLKDGERITQKSSRRANDDVTYEDQIGAEGKQSLMLSVTHSRLYLDCLSADAEGQYTCVAENGMIKKSQSTFVNVVRPDKTLFSEIHECQEKIK
uniref:Ig-like domain-containing protein n=1 Tax=Arion vulgaris TaxID=1028688 RepID=A0A0B7AV53_9EUPU